MRNCNGRTSITSIESADENTLFILAMTRSLRNPHSKHSVLRAFSALWARANWSEGKKNYKALALICTRQKVEKPAGDSQITKNSGACR